MTEAARRDTRRLAFCIALFTVPAVAAAALLSAMYLVPRVASAGPGNTALLVIAATGAVLSTAAPAVSVVLPPARLTFARLSGSLGLAAAGLFVYAALFATARSLFF